MRPHIGIIGGGNMGTVHGKAVRFLVKNGLVDAEIVGVAEADVERRAAYARASGARLATADPRELIASPEVNTVYICTPTASHHALAIDTLDRGKALFCEKPLAFNAEDAAAISDAAKRAGVTHQVGLVLRFSAIMNVTRELAQNPVFGRPMTATLIDDQFFPIQGHYASAWRGDLAQVGAGTLLEHAIHDVDMLASFFGAVKRVHGVTRDFSGRPGIEDLSVAILEFASGAVASHVSIWHNILHRGSSRRVSVTCENAQFRWDDNDWSASIRVDAQPDGHTTEISSQEVVDRHIRIAGIEDDRLRAVMTPQRAGQEYLLEDYTFLKAVSEEREAFPSFETAVYAHRVVDAIYQSARDGRPVDVESTNP